jgi:hypothetical protein
MDLVDDAMDLTELRRLDIVRDVNDHFDDLLRP